MVKLRVTLPCIQVLRIVNSVNACEIHDSRQATSRNNVSTYIMQWGTVKITSLECVSTDTNGQINRNGYVRPRALSISSLRHSDDYFVTFPGLEEDHIGASRHIVRRNTHLSIHPDFWRHGKQLPAGGWHALTSWHLRENLMASTCQGRKSNHVTHLKQGTVQCLDFHF